MRLVTRPDLDGLTCAVLLSRCGADEADRRLAQIVAALERDA